MKILDLKKTQDIPLSQKSKKLLEQFESFISELQKREIPVDVVQTINSEIKLFNQHTDKEKELIALLRETNKNILSIIKKELNLVPKFFYQNRWMVYGIIAGIIFSIILNQFGFNETWNSLAMGISMGLLFGMVAGKNRDEKMKKEGLQISI